MLRPPVFTKGVNGVRRWAVKAVLLLAVGIASGCSIINSPPVARIAAVPLSGQSPLSVSFDAGGSYDPDGSIRAYHWDFGDGSTGAGVTTEHTFVTATTESYTVVLTVTDDDGATTSCEQSIEVIGTGGGTGNNPPSARFTVAPKAYGDSPLTVTFDASLSTDVDGTIVAYAWDFGDGATGSGKILSHTFTAAATANFTVTLTVTDDRGASATTSAVISVLVPPDVPTDGPTAAFTASDPVTVFSSTDLPAVPSLFSVTFDPADSAPAPGHSIKTYIWDFGDGESASMSSDAPVTHTYASGAPVHTFVVTLTVIDDQGLIDYTTRNVTVRN